MPPRCWRPTRYRCLPGLARSTNGGPGSLSHQATGQGFDGGGRLRPFDYLSGRYGRDLGVVWLDTHPDISTTKESHHLHEMVVSFLLGKGAPGFNAHHPLASDQVILAGLIEEDLRPMDHNVFDYQVQRMTPKQLREPPNALSD